MPVVTVDAADMPSAALETLGPTDRWRKHIRKKRENRLDRVAVLDMETDPFDADRPHEKILPFVACLYSENFAPIVIWEEDQTAFLDKLMAEIEALPDAYTIYAHNGGKFDFMFLMSRLKGELMFKGRSLMTARIGRHELRDSFHIIPEKLAAYVKDEFDYNKLRKEARNKNRDAIVKYLINDCKYLLEIVRGFLDKFGFKITTGQAALAELNKSYKTERIMPVTDQLLRPYYFGGRVECIQGKGVFEGHYKLYDVNSMYPYVMATRQHPIGSQYIQRAGNPGPNTIFIQLECFSRGAFVCRSEDGETIAPWQKRRYMTTIWEYEVALKYKLIFKVKIICCIDCEKRSTFEKFVVPLYNGRLQTKKKLDGMEETDPSYAALKREDIFIKLILNSCYGKFAQNPRRFREHYITPRNERPEQASGEWGDFPALQSPDYWIWSRPTRNMNFNNVGTSASITGAARAVLLEAMQLAKDAIYCDTDSLICKDLQGVPIDKTALGAWDIEKEMPAVVIAGKKLYAYRDMKGKEKIKSKGTSGLNWNDMLRLLAGDVISTISKAPTLTRVGTQYYVTRKVRATAKGRKNVVYHESQSDRFDESARSNSRA